MALLLSCILRNIACHDIFNLHSYIFFETQKEKVHEDEQLSTIKVRCFGNHISELIGGPTIVYKRDTLSHFC